ncbi:hypothetical protein A2926_01330 [Candidatus Giovannonibacteria bacterium RIFCSPLOWO2_01_FULL_44_40]|uniref:Uncharacterized protein n=1 Tax=Candidatus Giovannonibacteria bacterium RIFCSPHIGHO2_01_FULL_45_23 TaxID=1798325 RepID=A0A1F5VHH6_9BACT|nr:MAG: hypothetical protein A2834_00645 [Candidatus Giovannonibacteria bacterium RIFCSPHIGHO2_01_FULL_45_23]OGF75862.1 MAG: hypothetical protein A3C77_02085 [Candidatus Giovannonibacteria bacterium RIFCSPHIGHO2_02_FULL_45_13]OGF79642.1 MAG: hypothetical protein A2926_01330 [Candidatus Giovannonibacteria bacterium RIFCSPLOWO2_01_FULL_44_40]
MGKKIVITPTEVAAEGLQEATGVEVKQYQFTKDAHCRVGHSFYKGELYGVYEGQHDVSLSQVEAEIFNFELRDARHPQLEVDGSIGELVHCDLEVSRDCVALGGLFLPKRWVSPRSGNSVGNYTPDLGEEFIAVCEPCKQVVADDVVVTNRKVAVNEQKMTPRFMKRESAERIVAARQKGAELRQRMDDKLSGIRERLRARQDFQR